MTLGTMHLAGDNVSSRNLGSILQPAFLFLLPGVGLPSLHDSSGQCSKPSVNLWIAPTAQFQTQNAQALNSYMLMWSLKQMLPLEWRLNRCDSNNCQSVLEMSRGPEVGPVLVEITSAFISVWEAEI